jgi:hypothetical protein
VKQVCATLENQQEILQEKQTLTTSNETYTLAVSELETKLVINQFFSLYIFCS